VVLALARRRPVALEVAQALKAPLDLILVRKIGVPWQPELAVRQSSTAKGANSFSTRKSWH
jgi:predicted phosphoribosyltransferase